MRKDVPAGAGEKMQYIVHAFNDNTIRFVLRYPFRIQPEALCQAVCVLAGSVEILHASFVPGRIGAHWHMQDIRADDCFTFVRTEDDPLTLALTLALEPISADDPVKLRCSLVHGEKDSAIALLVSHLCVDGSDGKYLLQKLCEAYSRIIQYGRCDQLDIKKGSRSAEQVYHHLSRQDRLKLLRDPRTGIKSVFPFPADAPGSPVVLRRQISADIMSAAHQRARNQNVTLNDLLLTACYYAYAETACMDVSAPLSIMSMMDLRRHCQDGDSPGLCNLTGGLVTALPWGLRASFDETLQDIASQTRLAKEDPLAGLYGMPLLHGAAKSLPMGLLLSAAGRLYGSMAMGLTNIGRLDSSSLLLNDQPPAELWFGGPIKKKPGMQVSCASLHGACSLSIWGYAAREDLTVLQQLLDSISRHIEAFSSAGN